MKKLQEALDSLPSLSNEASASVSRAILHLSILNQLAIVDSVRYDIHIYYETFDCTEVNHPTLGLYILGQDIVVL